MQKKIPVDNSLLLCILVFHDIKLDVCLPSSVLGFFQSFKLKLWSSQKKNQTSVFLNQSNTLKTAMGLKWKLYVSFPYTVNKFSCRFCKHFFYNLYVKFLLCFFINNSAPRVLIKTMLMNTDFIDQIYSIKKENFVEREQLRYNAKHQLSRSKNNQKSSYSIVKSDCFAS